MDVKPRFLTEKQAHAEELPRELVREPARELVREPAREQVVQSAPIAVRDNTMVIVVVAVVLVLVVILVVYLMLHPGSSTAGASAGASATVAKPQEPAKPAGTSKDEYAELLKDTKAARQKMVKDALDEDAEVAATDADATAEKPDEK